MLIIQPLLSEAMIEAIYTCVPLYLMLSWERYQARLRPDAVVNGFFRFGTRSVRWVSATVDCKCFEITASCEADLVPPPYDTTVLHTIARGRYLPAWKQRVTWYAQARGQFPNNPRCWSYLQAQGSTNVDMQKP